MLYNILLPIDRYIDKSTIGRQGRLINAGDQIIFLYFPNPPHQIWARNLADFDPTNTFLPHLISIKDRVLFPQVQSLDTLLHEISQSADLQDYNNLCMNFNFYLVDLQLKGKMKFYILILAGISFPSSKGIQIKPDVHMNILKFGYGINYKYESMLAHSFDSFYIIVTHRNILVFRFFR